MNTLIATLAVAACAGSAFATTTYFGEDLNPGGSLAGMVNSQAARAVFLGGLSNVGNETFESYAPGTTPPIGIAFQGAGTATLNGSGFVQNVSGTTGRFATSGSNWFETSSDGGFSISFDNPGGVAAFGFYGTDIGDFGNQLILRFTRADETTYDVVVPHTLGANGNPNGAGLFFGIIASASDAFTRVTFLNDGSGGDVFGFDDLVVGSLQQVVPMPAAAGLGLAGLAGVASRRRRSL